MNLRLYNVRTRQMEELQPSEAGKLGMYVCGLTVYDHAHLGHGRTAISFEMIRRVLEREFELFYVQNVTDVEDKILARAKELGVSPREHARKWDEACLKAMRRLGVRDPDAAPHVTKSIGQIITFIRKLIDRQMAYATPEGNVYFDVAHYDAHALQNFASERYGRLSNRIVDDMLAGTRKEVEGDKKHPADFVLWKRSEAGIHPDGEWPSPWGKGRPGWHIECSVMSTAALGETIDIHGGGQDLIFPHHENEIAQSQACTGKAPFANYWLHTGFLNVDGQKMSKSLGNFIVLTELLDELESSGRGPDGLRFYFIQTHYRSKIDFSKQGLQDAYDAVEKLERTRSLLREIEGTNVDGASSDVGNIVAETEANFYARLMEDFHTPTAIVELYKLQKFANGRIEKNSLTSSDAGEIRAAMERMGHFLTILDGPIRVTEVPDEVSTIVAARERARKEAKWSLADELRAAAKDLGYAIEDTATGPRVVRA